MKVRKNRIHQAGQSNMDFRSIDRDQDPSYRPPTYTSINFLAQHRPNNFSDIVKNKLQKSSQNPMNATQQFYGSVNKDRKAQTQLGYPRTAQLEEKDKQKRVFTGESNLLYSEKLYNGLYNTGPCKEDPSRKEEKKTSKSQQLINKKHTLHANAIQETQQVGMQEYAKDTLEGKVDLDKVREIRRAIRRRYANRKNFQKIFNSWDIEGKGYLTIKNIYDMVNNLGLKINLNEAQVLLASSDKNFNGLQSMDEFMDMIFNTQDALNVNLSQLKDLKSEEDYQQMMHMLEGMSKSSDNQKHRNQLVLILQKNVGNIYQHMLNSDLDKKGYINKDQFIKNLGRLNFPEHIMGEDDIKLFLDRYCENNQFDYKGFVTDIKDAYINPDDIYSNQQTGLDRLTCNIGEQQMINKMKEFDLKEQQNQQLGLQKCDQQPINLLELIHQKKEKMSKQIKNVMDKEQVHKHLVDKLGEFDEAEKKTVGFKQLKTVMQDLFKSNNIVYDERDMDRFLSGFTYNKHNQTQISQIPHIIFDETEHQFYQRANVKTNGPKPYDIFQNQKKALGDECPDQKEVYKIIKKFENGVFSKKNNSYEVFQEFDTDKDGFISKEDLVKTIKKLNLLNDNEIPQMMNYIDPEQKEYLDFNEFTKKVKSNMGNTDDFGKPVVIPYNIPYKEHAQYKSSQMDNIKQGYQSFSIPFQPKYVTKLEGKTRFGANPPHKNTFLNFQADQQSSLYINERERFGKTTKNNFQVDDKQRSQTLHNNRIEKIRNVNQKLANRIEQENLDIEQRLTNKINSQYLANWTYEHRAHIRNNWK